MDTDGIILYLWRKYAFPDVSAKMTAQALLAKVT
jgi:hypothetical protein